MATGFQWPLVFSGDVRWAQLASRLGDEGTDAMALFSLHVFGFLFLVLHRRPLLN